MKPIETVNHFNEITPQMLQKYGKTSVFLDVDNTLFIPKRALANQDVSDVIIFIERLKEANIDVIAMSNNYSLDRKEFFDQMKVQSIFFAKKPLKKSFKQAHNLLGNKNVDKSRIVHIGDQVLTDGLGAKWYDVDFIYVHPIRQKSDLIFALPSRILEKIFGIR